MEGYSFIIPGLMLRQPLESIDQSEWVRQKSIMVPFLTHKALPSNTSIASESTILIFSNGNETLPHLTTHYVVPDPKSDQQRDEPRHEQQPDPVTTR